MDVISMLQAALKDPQVRQIAVKTLVASAADACAAPGCSGKSPGTSCVECGVPMCLTHAAFRVRPAAPICVGCLIAVWGLADEDEPRQSPKKRSRR